MNVVRLNLKVVGGSAPFVWNVQCADLQFSEYPETAKDPNGKRNISLGARYTLRCRYQFYAKPG